MNVSINEQEILHLDEAAIKDEIGIKNSAHRAKIVSSLVLLRAKSNLSEYNTRSPFFHFQYWNS